MFKDTYPTQLFSKGILISWKLFYKCSLINLWEHSLSTFLSKHVSTFSVHSIFLPLFCPFKVKVQMNGINIIDANCIYIAQRVFVFLMCNQMDIPLAFYSFFKCIPKAFSKNKVWESLCFADDTFSLWPHAKENLNQLLIHLNSVCEDINFTLKVEKEFFLCHQKPDGSLFIQVYQKENSYKQIPP